ncbi:MAG: malto-oligosyltrehalose trehalohydrolase [Pirellulaceae bacterium]
MFNRQRPLLATDMDGTLLPLRDNDANLNDLRLLLSHVEAGKFDLAFVTGRDRDAMLEACELFQIPWPEVAICDGGTSVVAKTASGSMEYVDEYYEHLHASFQPFATDDLAFLLRDCGDLRLRAPEKQNPFKASYFSAAEGLLSMVDSMRQRLTTAGIACEIVSGVNLHWGDGLIDILPPGLSKAYALQWWLDRVGADRSHVYFAGDGGNDLEVFLSGYRSIVVRNCDAIIASQVYRAHRNAGSLKDVYFAEALATSGVLEGCRWFDLIESDDSSSQCDAVFGAVPVSRDATRFKIWAPYAKRLAVEKLVDGKVERFRIRGDEHGFFQRTIRGIGPGDRYQISLEDRVSRCDPASNFQPEGVHGPSQVVHHRGYAWRDEDYAGVAKSDLVIYELHLGTFTTEGTTLAAIDRLPELIDLGVTAVELMPLAQCAGQRNWGYDGVDLFAPNHVYGTPEDLKEFVDACHALGLAVILDVVYNHLGPEGNYLHDFGPYFSKRFRTPWGDALDYDGDDHAPVRRFVIENAVYWLREYHLDGLRMDAVHFMFDDSRHSILQGVRRAVHAFAETVKRPIHLIAEANIYDHTLVSPRDGIAYDAIWSDDIMHSIYSHTAEDFNLAHRHYGGASDIEEALRFGFLHTGPVVTRVDADQRSQLHDVGNLSYLPSLVCGLQTHDAVGNHPRGLRFHHLTSKSTQRAAIPLLMLYPSIPLIFMGEEHACDSPFMFFVDFGNPQLRRAVDRGRRNEYPQHKWRGAIAPSEIEAFEKSKAPQIDDHSMWQWYRDLIALRKQWRSNGWIDWRHLNVRCHHDHCLFAIEYHPPETAPLFVVSRFSSNRRTLEPLPLQFEGEELMSSNVARDAERFVVLQDQSVLIGKGTWNWAPSN